jgi:hypothetical protein
MSKSDSPLCVPLRFLCSQLHSREPGAPKIHSYLGQVYVEHSTDPQMITTAPPSWGWQESTRDTEMPEGGASLSSHTEPSQARIEYGFCSTV